VAEPASSWRNCIGASWRRLAGLDGLDVLLGLDLDAGETMRMTSCLMLSSRSVNIV
jgi:hypothetical protein